LVSEAGWWPFDPWFTEKKEVKLLVDSTSGRKSGKNSRGDRINRFVKYLKVNASNGLTAGDAPGIALRWLIPVICLLILSSCGMQLPFVKDNDESGQKVILSNPPRSIAILPFGNKTEVEDIDNFVRTTLYSHLTPHPYRDIELHEVDRKLKRYNLMNYEKLRKVSAKRLGRILRSDAVIIGEVTEFQRVYAGVYSQMAIGASISMWDTRTGKKLWSDEHVTRHHEGGIPLAITDLAMISIRSGLNLTDAEKVKTVDELSRHLISRVPVPNPYSDGRGSKLVSLKRLTKKKNATPHNTSTTKHRSLKKITKGSPQQYR
jgi:hypothetical protein